MDEFMKSLTEMNLAQVEEIRSGLESEIREATSQESLEEIKTKVEAVQTRIAELKELETRKAAALELQNGAPATIKEKREGETEMPKMKMEEFRDKKQYIDAYAEYVKTGKDEELRKLLTENVEDGTIAVPTFVYDIVKTAWDKNEIMSLVTKTELAGNLKVQFEISGTDAVVHTEGGDAVAEETLTEGIVTLVPAYIKKWISISDEVMSMRGEAFLRYIYAELTQKIVNKIADILVGKIAALPQVATATSPAADKVALAPAVGTVATAIAHLSDEAANPVVTMNKLTWSEFKTAQYANGFAVDPFEGLAVKFNNSLPAYSAASAGDVYMIVGDYAQGAIANYPNGDSIEFKFDDLTRKKEDLVEVLGKEYVAVDVVANKAFTLVSKPETV